MLTILMLFCNLVTIGASIVGTVDLLQGLEAGNWRTRKLWKQANVVSWGLLIPSTWGLILQNIG